MTIETVAATGIESVLNGTGSVVTVLSLVLLAVCYICWKFIQASNEQLASLYADNKALTERIFGVIQDNGKIISALTEAIKDVQRK